MGETTFRQVEAIFHEALKHPPARRSTFLDSACNGNDRIRREVERLLALDEAEAGLLDNAPWKREAPAIEPAADPLAQPGARIGRYRLLERISAGGMGTVWLAERADSHFEQRVAIKLIKRGMDTEDILRRFRTERQVLAGLQHANIARLLDGGATDDGRPYLVMEFIDGRPIDAYCEANELSTRQRVELFVNVCGAVQTAHRNLVIHRDLKPSNILVTADGEPKLLDFGIAKLLSDEGTAATATGMRVMTPRYASPEQIRGDRITTASDVYSLGAILYQLLTGRGPYELATEDRREIERAVLRQEPRRPSTASGRQPVAGDLDTIVLKALAKDPQSRYGSPEQLADDLLRFLDGKPILARPAGVGTRILKALRRNRRAVAAALVGGTISLVMAVALSVYLFIVPTWVQGYLDAARLELLDPEQSNKIYVAVNLHDAGVTIGAPEGGLQRSLACYDKALLLYPTRADIRLERDLVRHAAGEPSDIDESALDDRSRGILAMLTGDIRTAVTAWSSLDLVSNPDPLVEGMLGILYLATDEPARAYPRLTSAHKALPEAGFLCLRLADAAAQCGDAEAARTLLDRARGLAKLDDRTGTFARVEADTLVAAGRYDEALLAYGSILPQSNLVATIHHADLLERLGRAREGLGVLAWAVREVYWWVRADALFIDRAERWWARLDEQQRAALIDEGRADDPLDQDSFSSLLFSYRIAALAMRKAGPPLDLTGRPAPPAPKAAAPPVAPTLADLAADIDLMALKAWADACGKVGLFVMGLGHEPGCYLQKATFSRSKTMRLIHARHVAAALSVAALTAAPAAAQMIDLNAVGDCGPQFGDGILMMLDAGTWKVTPVQGTYLAWTAWPVVAGCDEDGANCDQGWWWRLLVRTSSETLIHYGTGLFSTAEAAFAAAEPFTFTLEAQDTVEFRIVDNQCADNSGGLSFLLEPTCPWDCDGSDDGEIGIEDFLAVLGQWGTAGSCDFDASGDVGIEDFLKVLGLWGPCP